VRNELRLGNETSIGGKAFDLLGSALFPEGHPMHRGTIGTHASLDSITMDDARAWVKKYYRPENCTIVIAGDVDPHEREEAARHLAGRAAVRARWPTGPGRARAAVDRGPAVAAGARAGEHPDDSREGADRQPHPDDGLVGAGRPAPQRRPAGVRGQPA
jgi:hypothetical protein